MNRPDYIEEMLHSEGPPPFMPRFARHTDDETFPAHLFVPGIGWVVWSVAGWN